MNCWDRLQITRKEPNLIFPSTPHGLKNIEDLGCIQLVCLLFKRHFLLQIDEEFVRYLSQFQFVHDYLEHIVPAQAVYFAAKAALISIWMKVPVLMKFLIVWSLFDLSHVLSLSC